MSVRLVITAEVVRVPLSHAPLVLSDAHRGALYPLIVCLAHPVIFVIRPEFLSPGSAQGVHTANREHWSLLSAQQAAIALKGPLLPPSLAHWGCIAKGA